MFTPGFRLLAALAAAGLLGAFVSGVGSSDEGIVDTILGPITLGWKGSVGDHLAYVVLVGMALLAGTLAGILIAFRDADPEAEAQVAMTEVAPLTRAPAGTNFLPILAAFAVGVIVVGQISSRAITLAGVGLLIVVGVVWMLRAWAERATGDDRVNWELYHRLIEPLRIPVLSGLAIAVIIIGFSRVLLALSHTGAVAVFGVVGAIFLLVIGFVAAKPSITKNTVTILLFIGAVAVIAAGIAAAVVGEQSSEHETDHTEQSAPAPSSSQTAPGAPVVPPAQGGDA